MALIDLKSDLSLPTFAGTGQKIIGRPSVTAIARDTERVTKFLISPKGLLFTAKQFALQMMNPNVENIIGSAGIGLTKIYDPISPITNTAGAPLGLRTDRHMPPIVRSNGPVLPSTYEAVHKSKSDLFHLNNRLINLKNELLKPAKEAEGGNLNLIGKIKNTLQDISNKFRGYDEGWEGKPINVLTGITGPNSLGGIGATTIRRYVNTSLDAQKKFTTTGPKGRGDFKNPHYYNINNSYADYPENDLRTENRPEAQIPKTPIQPKDVRGNVPTLENYLPYNNIPTRNGKKEDLDFRALRTIGLTNPDLARYSEEFNRKSNFGNTLALINKIDQSIDESLIPFKFGDISFKAYLGTMSDNFAPEWNSEADHGRADPRYQYTGFERTLTLDFIVASEKQEYALEIWEKLQKLAQITHPVYGEQGFYGQTTNVTIGRLFVNKPMIITDLGYDWDNETPWEIDKDYQAPLYTSVNMTCTVLGDRPQNTSKMYGIKGL